MAATNTPQCIYADDGLGHVWTSSGLGTDHRDTLSHMRRCARCDIVQYRTYGADGARWRTQPAPRVGQRVVVHGAPFAGCTPAPDGGRFATYVGTVNGHWTFQGRTADRYHAVAGTVTWEPRR